MLVACGRKKVMVGTADHVDKEKQQRVGDKKAASDLMAQDSKALKYPTKTITHADLDKRFRECKETEGEEDSSDDGTRRATSSQSSSRSGSSPSDDSSFGFRSRRSTVPTTTPKKKRNDAAPSTPKGTKGSGRPGKFAMKQSPKRAKAKACAPKAKAKAKAGTMDTARKLHKTMHEKYTV